MSVRIDFLVSDEIDAQIKIFCNSKSINKHQFVIELIKEELSEFFKQQEQDKLMRKSWSIENGNSNPNLIEIGKSFTIPPAY